MALQHSRAVEVADAIATVSNEMTKLLARVDQVLEHNSDQAIDWAAAATPAYIDEEANGNLSGRTFSRQAVANAVGTLDQFRKLLTNLSPAQGDHLGNLNQLARPLG
jgi:hypothetical protein